ncbi:3-mercaptopyruvate sulfurtransferase [Jeotgalibacillus alimentarius]|uniref:3-mercaptopyruvate sulfurtransferase n=1 Tax=Jeotgalibacillus alimentarius TaxID=135826 RepID=A0A0C2VWV3_9BACL|nr:sulfurtransferase [Jeotgalibacillus alimentarius]KIL48881.1 3-mercaptopyruvate sulfurtransferase [Jeotgalibacillus alimentarius]
MQFSVTAEWLNEQIRLKKTVTILDCRFDLKKPDAGEAEYLQSHIPGAVYIHLNRDLSGKVKNHGGRHPLPEMDRFRDKMQQAGVNDDELIIVYDGGEGAFAARAWWLLTFAGHKQTFLLDGGYSEWREKGYPLSETIPDVQRGTFKLDLQLESIAETAEVEQIVDGYTRGTLIDSRESARYRGDHEPIDKVAGHIPGALNYEWFESYQAGNLLKPDDQKKRFSDLDPDQPLIVYCGSGVTACPNIIALKMAGFKHVKLYTGSYSDWISYTDHEIETGETNKKE